MVGQKPNGSGSAVLRSGRRAPADGPAAARPYGRRMPTEIHLDTPRENVSALLIRLDRIAASTETLRAMTDHNGGEFSPSLPPLLHSLERDLTFAAREIHRLTGCLPR